MPTVIDSFVVTLGLDRSQFDKSQKEATVALKKTGEEAKKSGEQIEEAGNKAGKSLHNVALEALALFAVFAGSSAVKNFVTDMISATAALGRFSTQIGAPPQIIAAWENAAERVGGSAGATAASFSKMADALQQLHQFGQNLPPEFYRLVAESHTTVDTEHGPAKFMLDLAHSAQALARVNPARAAFYLKGMGIDQGTITLMTQGGTALDAYIKSLEKLSPTDAQIAASEKLVFQYTSFSQSLGSLAYSILPALEKALGPVLEKLSAWLDANHDLISAKLGEMFDKVASALNSITWDDVVGGFSALATNAQRAATAIEAIVGAMKDVVSYGETFSKFMSNSTGAQGPHELGEHARSWISSFFGSSSPTPPAPAIKNTPSSQNRFMGHATGGAVGGGKTIIVGEQGPEVFTPNQSGSITPNSGLGAFGKGDLQVDGRVVNTSNPVPVQVTSLGQGSGGGENWLQTVSKWFGGSGGGGSGGGGGGGSGGGAGGADGGPYNPAIGAPGKYRPIYKLGNRDLSDAVVNTINGEATSSTQSTDAVINNMMNRLGTHGYGPSGDLQAVARAPGQYAGYRAANAARAQMIRDRIKAIASGTVPDNTNGSNEYRAGWYMGPWGRKHLSSPVVGGNRFAYNSKGGRGAYAPYEHPHEDYTGGARFAAAVKDAQSTTNNTQSSNLHIGTINVHTQATDAPGVAAALQNALKRQQQVAKPPQGPT